MHFHVPKPLHGWRAFAGEVGIIVLGVLIALAAGQIVESIHDRYLARQALSHIRGELAYDSAFAAERIAIGDCMRSSFTDLRQRLIASGDDWPGLQGKPISGAPNSLASSRSLYASPPPLSSPHRLWPVSAWTAATSSGVFDRGQKRFFNYAALYTMVDWFSRLQEHEIADYSNLTTFDVPQKLDPTTRLQLLRDVGAVDSDNADLERLAAVFVTATTHNGIPPDRTWLGRVLRSEAQGRGKCVKQGPALDAAIKREFDTRLHL